MTALLLAFALSAKASFFSGDGLEPASGVKSNPAQSLALLSRFQNEQDLVVKLNGGELVVLPLWEDSRVNATARRDKDEWIIEVYGGLLTHPAIGENELLLILCHELGHHLGGAPTASRGGWASCEGQADYWSAKNCGHLLANATETMLQLTRLYASQGTGGYPQLDTPDLSRASRTFFGYPSPQCRLDTLLAGMSGEERPMCWFAK